MSCHPRVVPVRLREHVEALGCDRLRGIGFRFVCDCGMVGPVRRSRVVAAADLHEHRASVSVT